MGSALVYLALLLPARSRWGGKDDLGENVDYCCNRYCCCQLTCGRTGRMRNQGIGGGLAVEQNPVKPVGIASRRGNPVLYFCFLFCLLVCVSCEFLQAGSQHIDGFFFFLINICSPVKYPFTLALGAVFTAALVLPYTAVSIAQLFNLAVTLKANNRAID